MRSPGPCMLMSLPGHQGPVPLLPFSETVGNAVGLVPKIVGMVPGGMPTRRVQFQKCMIGQLTPEKAAAEAAKKVGGAAAR